MIVVASNVQISQRTWQFLLDKLKQLQSHHR
jgi:hypothetical protein